MAKRKIMTIDDLYSFCLKNNFTHFSSNVMGEEIVINMPATFEKQKKDENRMTEGMTPFVSKAFHDHINLNKSSIPEEPFRENVPSSNLRPILANIVLNEETGLKDFGSHDFDIVTDENGEEHYVYYEQPVGVIDGSRTTIEYDKEAKVNRAILHGFLYDGYCQDAIDILDRRGETACSVELSIRNMSFDTNNKVLSLDDFYVSGLTLLGNDVAPGMAGSNLKIEDFALSNTATFEVTTEITKLLQELSDKIDNLSSYTNDSMKGGKNVTKFEMLLNQYNKTVEDITFEYEGLSDEELEIAFENAFVKKLVDDDVPATPIVDDSQPNENQPENNQPESQNSTDEPNGEDTDPETNDESGENAEGGETTFSKTFEISHEDVRTALYGLLSSYEDADNDWYWIEHVYDTYFVYSNWDDSKTFGQKYIKDGDNISFAEERYELYKELLTASEKASLEEMRSNYSKFEEVSEKLSKYEAEPTKMEILESADYGYVADTEEFVELKKQENHFDLSVEEVKEKANNILLEYAKKGALNFSSNVEKQTVGMHKIGSTKTNTKRSRYGGLGKKEN